MPTLYTDTATDQNTELLATRTDGQDISAKRFQASALYTLPSNLTPGDIIRIAKLPPTAEVDAFASSIFCEDPGTTLTLDIGDDDDADRYADNLAIASGGHYRFSASSGDQNLNPHRLESDGWISATVVASSTLTAGNKVRFRLVYSVS